MIVVTGGAGFVGSHLAETLVKDPKVQGRGPVRIVDDFSTGHWTNLEPFRDSLEVFEGCITDRNLLQSAFEGAEVVFHEAASASVVRSLDEPLAVHDVNATGTLQVLDVARECGVKRVVLASSSAIYGENEGRPGTESDHPNPESPYAAQKLLGEHYAQVYAQAHGLHCVMLRYYNVYGPRQDPSSPYSGVISIFADRLIAGETAQIFGDGGQTRDFVFVKDVVRANCLAAFGDVERGAVFNVATGVSVSIRELYDKMASILGSDVVPQVQPARAGEIRHSRANTDRARKSLGFVAESSLDQGLQETLAWAQQSVHADSE